MMDHTERVTGSSSLKRRKGTQDKERLLHTLYFNAANTFPAKLKCFFLLSHTFVKVLRRLCGPSKKIRWANFETETNLTAEFLGMIIVTGDRAITFNCAKYCCRSSDVRVAINRSLKTHELTPTLMAQHSQLSTLKTTCPGVKKIGQPRPLNPAELRCGMFNIRVLRHEDLTANARASTSAIIRLPPLAYMPTMRACTEATLHVMTKRHRSISVTLPLAWIR